jgi:hypothetical protein
VKIYYLWTPSHCGIQGNEQADAAAKEAASITDIDPKDEYRSLANVHRVISERVTKTTKRFITEHLNSNKFAWDGRRKMKTQLQKEKKRDASVFWQFASGHALTGDYLKNKIRKTGDDTCWLCISGEKQTRGHLFNSCKALEEERRGLWKDCLKAARKAAKAKKKPAPKTVPVRELFSQDCYTGAVMEFLKKTKVGRTGRPPDEAEGQAE